MHKHVKSSNTLISVRVHTNSSQHGIVKKNDILHVYIHAVPQNGKANAEVIKVLSEYLALPPNCISIKSGYRSKDKIILVRKS